MHTKLLFIIFIYILLYIYIKYKFIIIISFIIIFIILLFIIYTDLKNWAFWGEHQKGLINYRVLCLGKEKVHRM